MLYYIFGEACRFSLEILVSIYLEKPFDVADLILWLGPVDFGFNVLQLALRLEIDVDFVGHLGTTDNLLRHWLRDWLDPKLRSE